MTASTMHVLIYTGWPVNAWRIPAEQVARLQRAFHETTFIHATTADEASRDIANVDASLSPFLTQAILDQATRLRWVHSSAAAVADLLPLEELARRDIVVTNSRGVQAIPMAEQVMAGLLLLARRLDLTMAAQRERRWIQEQLGDVDRPWMLHGKSMTIIGLGSIGEAIAERAHAFGMRITGVRRRPEQPVPPFVHRILGANQLDDALKGADVIVITAPFVAATTRLIGNEQLKLINRGAILVNVGRAQIVDTDAMIRALEDGRLGGAVLDVFEHEPLDPSSPLWAMHNVVITPHSAGFRATHWHDVVDLFADNLRRFQRGDPLHNVVDPAAGY